METYKMPYLDDDSKSVTVTLRMNSKLKSQLDYVANHEYRTINSLVTYICAKYIERYNTTND